ncbi:hypothetical protein P7B02_18300 [Caulobacter segnis]|uniref:hypothetical protein n=1 Tax=Caulobacter segnis TaxID=88688 RepID=UPI00240F67EA|nr:hypothetical protein [Caulobacter segnis]MDG2523485.1 hypothetical protein [Caulobacter segnis]
MPKQASENPNDDASEDVSELFRRISQPDLGYHSFDLALQDEDAPTVADVKKLARKLDVPPTKPVAAVVKPAEVPLAKPASPAGGGKLLRAWSPEAPPEPEAQAPAPAAAPKADGTDLKAMFSAFGKAKPPRSSR